MSYNVQIQTTSLCNGSCVMCPYPESWHSKNPGVMSDEVFGRIIEGLTQFKLKKVCAYLENDPFMDPGILDRIETIIRRLRFKSLEISTNAERLTPDKVERLAELLSGVEHEILISFHGVDKATHEGIMGIDHERTLANVLHLTGRAAERGLNIKIRGAGLPQHDDLLHGMNFNMKDYLQFWDRQFDQAEITERPKVVFFRYHDRCGNIKRNAIRLKSVCRADLVDNVCPRISGWLHFLYTGELCLCCMDYHHEEIFGNICEDSIETIVSSARYKRLLMQCYGLMESPPDFICKRCLHPNG